MKLFWFYLLDRCDHAGVWDVDMERASFSIGTELKEKDVLKIFSRKIIPFKQDKWFIPKFIEYQYGQLNESNRAHLSVIKILTKYNLIKGLNEVTLGAYRIPKGAYRTPKGAKDKDKVKVKDKLKDKEEQVSELKSNIKDLQKEFPEVDVNNEFLKFATYLEAHGKTYKNYNAAFLNWLRSDFTPKKEKKLRFKKTPLGEFIAYCSKCGNQLFFPNVKSLHTSSECHSADLIPERILN